MVEGVLGFIAETDLTAEEVIPGLMVAVMTLATDTSNPSQALDEAVRLLDEVRE